jgi:hypothetical protein
MMSLRNLLPGSVDANPRSGDDPSRFHSRFFEAILGAEKELWFVAVALMLVDVTLTVHGLQLGLREMNPVAKQALDAVGVLGLYGLKGTALAVGLCCRPLLPIRLYAIIPLALLLPSLLAVILNTLAIAIVVI